MAILIDVKFPEWLKDEELFRELSPLLPDVDIRLGANPGRSEDVEMLIVSNYRPQEALKYPNLKLIQKTGAGIENILRDKTIPLAVQLARSNAAICGEEMAEYALAFVLQEQRRLRVYQEQQQRRAWDKFPPPYASKTKVAILGLGRMGQIVASRFAANKFKVTGWSRSQKAMGNVDCYSGMSGLLHILENSDFVISVLPTTEETREMFNMELFCKFNRKSIFINIGRGDQVNEPDLIKALDTDQLSGAILDVCLTEPLPANDPLWSHPKVQITPHISGWHSYSAEDLAENYARLRAGKPLLNQVDRERGY